MRNQTSRTSASVSGDLEELATCQVASLDRITAAQASSARALQGATVANDLAAKSIKFVKEVSAIETANNIATQKQVKDHWPVLLIKRRGKQHIKQHQKIYSILLRGRLKTSRKMWPCRGELIGMLISY